MRLTAKGLSCRIGQHMLFRDVDFTVRSGELLRIEGRNGAGKTTLLRGLVGISSFHRGSVSLEDDVQDIADRTLFIGHNNALKAALTVEENLVFWQNYFGEGHRLDHALTRLDLQTLRDIPVGFLSAGQARRVALARLLLTARPIWLLDEPNDSLDHHACQRLADVITAHLSSGGMVIASSHHELGISAQLRLNLDQHR